jgi:hypothetical protein
MQARRDNLKTIIAVLSERLAKWINRQLKW